MIFLAARKVPPMMPMDLNCSMTGSLCWRWLAKQQASNEGAGWQPVLEVKATTVHKSRLTPRRAVFGATTCSEVKTETGTSCALFFFFSRPFLNFRWGDNTNKFRPLPSRACIKRHPLPKRRKLDQLHFLSPVDYRDGCFWPSETALASCSIVPISIFRAYEQTIGGSKRIMVAKTNTMLGRMSRRMSSASPEDYDDDTSSYLFLSQRAAAHVEPSKSKSNENKKPNAKSKQRQQRTSSGKNMMQKKLVVLTKGISKIPGRLRHRRTSSSATATTGADNTDADVTFVSHEISESASGIDVSLEESIPPAITTEDDVRSLGTSNTTATDATAQVGNLTPNANNCVLSSILPVDASVDISQVADGSDDDDADLDDDFDEDDPIIIAGSPVAIDYVYQEPQISSPNATGGRKHHHGGTSGASMSSSPVSQDNGRGALAKSSIFVDHTTTTTAGAGSSHAAGTHAHTSTEAPPPISLARPITSSSFMPTVVEVPVATTNTSDGIEWEYDANEWTQEKMTVLERFLDRFSCGTGCDSTFSIYEM